MEKKYLVCFGGFPLFVGTMEQVKDFLDDEVDCGSIRQHISVYEME